MAGETVRTFKIQLGRENIERMVAMVNASREESQTDKATNAAYWDSIDDIVQIAIAKIATLGGIPRIDLYDFDLVKEVVDLITSRLEAQHGANFPFVDENL